MSDDAEVFARGRRTDKVYFSREFSTPPAVDEGAVVDSGPKRYAYRVLENGQEVALADIRQERIIHVTPSGRQEIKALFFVDNREIQSLTLQRFTVKDGKPHQQHFTFAGDEIGKLLDLAHEIADTRFDGDERVRLDAADLRRFSVTSDAVAEVARQNLPAVAEIVEQEALERDVVAIAYRRSALKRFKRMLEDPSFFNSEAKRLAVSAERAWQQFFEDNTWIFGYGLFYVFTSALPDHKLEQVVAGSSIASHGKRSDALLMTHGRIGSLCFGEIKTHRAPLIESDSYRPGAWAPSRDVVRAVAQVQRTVELAEKTIRGKLEPRDASGNAVGDALYVIRPRSILVIGSLNEFIHDERVNEPKLSSFELYRRQLAAPDIITFDELYERARFITECEADKRNI